MAAGVAGLRHCEGLCTCPAAPHGRGGVGCSSVSQWRRASSATMSSSLPWTQPVLPCCVILCLRHEQKEPLLPSRNVPQNRECQKLKSSWLPTEIMGSCHRCHCSRAPHRRVQSSPSSRTGHLGKRLLLMVEAVQGGRRRAALTARYLGLGLGQWAGLGRLGATTLSRLAVSLQEPPREERRVAKSPPQTPRDQEEHE